MVGGPVFGANYVVQGDGRCREFRVFNPVSLDGWRLPGGPYFLAIPTADGQHAHCFRGALSGLTGELLLDLAGRLGAWRLRQRLAETAVIELYERPGILRARSVSHTRQYWSRAGNFGNERLSPSPDGHSLVITAENAGECLLFRW